MNSVLFYDPLCRQPYDTRTLHTCALGGTEATLTRVADALDAFVIQHNRAEDWGRYRRPQRISGITHVIVNRDSRALPLVAKHYPGARTYLWLHDQVDRKSTRLNSSHDQISYAVFCLKKKKRRQITNTYNNKTTTDS